MAIFSNFLPKLLVAEGGYQKMSADNGNYNSLGQLVGTNRGISAPVYEFWIGRPPTIADMQTLTLYTAQAIYKKLYWDKIKADQIKTQEVANIIADHGVNAGTGSAGKIVQRALNQYFNKNLMVDGAIGNLTVSAINSVNQSKLFDAILQKREQFYKRLNQPQFLQGWLNRLRPFYEDGIYLATKYGKKTGIRFLTILGVSATVFFFLIKKYNN